MAQNGLTSKEVEQLCSEICISKGIATAEEIEAVIIKATEMAFRAACVKAAALVHDCRDCEPEYLSMRIMELFDE